jgi:hypothetical protein
VENYSTTRKQSYIPGGGVHSVVGRKANSPENMIKQKQAVSETRIWCNKYTEGLEQIVQNREIFLNTRIWN